MANGWPVQSAKDSEGKEVPGEVKFGTWRTAESFSVSRKRWSCSVWLSVHDGQRLLTLVGEPREYGTYKTRQEVLTLKTSRYLVEYGIYTAAFSPDGSSSRRAALAGLATKTSHVGMS